jgi:RecA/RadA recombinase
MAKIKEAKVDSGDEKKEKEVITPQKQALAFLKANKDDHYNFEESNYYKVPSSSLNLNLELGGGIPVGAHRAIGINSGGKTSCSLDFMFNFLKLNKTNRGVYFKCEGRLSPDMQSRSGINFTTDPEKWDNNCLIIESNVYEAVFGFIRDCIINNPTKAKYFFIIDSMDNMGKRDDLAKPLEEAGQVAGGALLTSVFLKKSSLALEKRGHILIFISQIREEIKLNQYQATTPRQGKSSGGHAVEHNSSVVMDFLPRFNDDIIRENPADKNSKIIGHYCKICLIKTDNEKNQVKLSYPIKYGRVGGTSVWKEREICQQLLMWEFLKKTGEKSSWLSLSENIRQELLLVDKDVPEKIQGEDNVCNYLESHPEVTQYLYLKFRDILLNNEGN